MAFTISHPFAGSSTMEKRILLITILLMLSSILASEYATADSSHKYGDIVITEIMKDPDAVSDTFGEWFEIYNKSGATINLKGWTVHDYGTESFQIEGDVLINGGQYLVMGRNADPEMNGGVPVDYEYGGAMWLGQNEDEIIIIDTGFAEIARVEYDSREWPDSGGASMNLCNFNFHMNTPDYWFASHIDAYGDGDYGTPGSCCEPFFLVKLENVPEHIFQGDSIEFDIYLTQPSNSNTRAKVWLAAGRNECSYVIDEITRSFPSRFSIRKHSTLRIPPSTPPGKWVLSIKVGPDQGGYEEEWYSYDVEVEILKQ
jgi:hypothetical protein